MFNVSGKTARILAAFTAASVACVAGRLTLQNEKNASQPLKIV